MSKELREGMMLLAELHADGNDFKSAVGLYQPVIDDILKDPNTKTLDDTTLRIFNGAVQAYLQLNDVEKATAVGMKLLELGPDDGPVNLAIMNFAKRLEIERKKAIPESGDASGEAAAKLKSYTDLQVKIMVDLAKREKLSAGAMVWIVKTCSTLGTEEADTAATDLVKKIFVRGDNDPDFDSQIEKAKPGLRTMAATIEAKRGQYEDAVTNVEQLIKQFPKALEPRITRAQILMKWAAKDPSKYNEAIGAWDTLRKKLEKVTNKSGGKMNEFYDALYNESFCFFKMAEKSGNKEQAKTGFDLMLPYLKLDPKITGPKRDRELSAKYFQLAGKLADLIGVARPVQQSSRPAPKPVAPAPAPEKPADSGEK
jgi:tetratricopeptide (TPR) repeat protein